MTTTLSPAEHEMKLMVTKTLEAQGVLSHIKAQLRAAVIKALHETSPSPPSLGKAHLLRSADTHLALCVIADFLRQLDLHETLSVLSTEVESPLLMDRQTLAKEIGLPDASEKIALLLTALAPRAPPSAKASQDLPKTRSAEVDESEDDEPAPSIFSAVQKQSLPVHSAEPLVRPATLVATVATPTDEGDDDEQVESEMEASMGDVSESFEDSSASREAPKATEQPTPSPATLEASDDEYTFISQATPQSRMSSLPPAASSQRLGDRNGLDDGNDKTLLSVAAHVMPSDKARDENDDDDDENAADEEARLSSLDATLKAMEAEDETGTLKQLKASLQHELDVKSDDDQYGSDFEEDFDAEEDIASDVEDDIDASVAESQDESFQAPASDKRVRSTDVLDDYDYVETIQKP
ncbi:hypothetical protein SPRG_08576 [Saprolegnia parasitica CBS 223.65]|uniref:LisH domain-containing protein n=1 Tax=Saprolegnia parasitica (strain CBS 223.65) TaxID=695850 RepID=A0A067C644_SAPPC|nr:hypothetical protein SPRG_08576 [Saprolegnia parasitica CBS 223.65]KDO26214.1 hypothetical protein SPRG_08576 [Saprolegnia parasitica CBS 223.65]|eukprot:XP_012203206.1 hypothetical protein SPRG_08576 [Saprolegnia parasitica CBS 223.65]